jgi:glycosyltransferase involved in cell wall biosynthesis
VLQFLAELDAELLAVFFSHDHEVAVQESDVPEGVTTSTVYSEPVKALSRAGRIVRIGRQLQRRPAWASWERDLAGRVRTWEPDLVVALGHSDRRNLDSVTNLAPLILFAEEDATLAPGYWPERSLAGRGLRWAELWSERRGRQPARVVVISERERAWARRTFPRSQISVVPHNLDHDYWTASPPTSAAGPRRDVFVLCRLDHERNAHGLVEVSRALARRAADGAVVPRLIVASSEEPHSSFEQAAHELIDFVGAVPEPRPYYWSAAATLVPSFIVMGVKTTILQGWATGCPVVTTTAAAASVGAVDGRELLAGASPDAVADLLVRIASDARLGERVAAAGQRRYELVHSPDAVRVSLRAVFAESALARSVSGRARR